MSLAKTTLLKKNQDLKNTIPAIALLMGFVFTVSASIYFIKEKYGTSCKCGISLEIIIAILASSGVFIGVLIYYFLSKSFSKEKEQIFINIEKILDFLDKEEKTIITSLIKHNGELNQNILSNLSKINPVKLHRRLSKMESKGIIHKIKKGLSKKIILNEAFKELFIK